MKNKKNNKVGDQNSKLFCFLLTIDKIDCKIFNFTLLSNTLNV